MKGLTYLFGAGVVGVVLTFAMALVTMSQEKKAIEVQKAASAPVAVPAY